VPCYRCGVRQTDPERGQSPWRRGVVHDRLVLICPGCQERPDWTAELERCANCRSAHLIRRLGQVECLDCGLVQDAEAALVPAGAPDAAGRGPAAAGPGQGHDALAEAFLADTSLADEVSRALDRLLGRA
jgi:hypothetical protein